MASTDLLPSPPAPHTPIPPPPEEPKEPILIESSDEEVCYYSNYHIIFCLIFHFSPFDKDEEERRRKRRRTFQIESDSSPGEDGIAIGSMFIQY